ncbi:DNA polymerase III subunit chi [Candidatus Pelagadaptatus aseana]|uniref:DNA polymerase III subunit chi n=1 Tax=Candidatus Pelagadaptatus aseana TaxID=3120508 RepID=UPI003C702076
MTRISFYILGDDNDDARKLFACRLAEKAWREGNRIYIAVNDAAEAEALDQQLWRFRPESFVPHSTEHSETPSAAVVIGCQDDCGDHHDLLINLRSQIPSHFSRFERLVEIVSQSENILTETREHFTFYKQRGYPIETHKIG